ncbi:hypothetical protein Y695_00420 [Hydrogenophaga sp. T4]|nr:hypothetical protein Y695_00420 [Hydrogenophaga sp. T4]
MSSTERRQASPVPDGAPVGRTFQDESKYGRSLSPDWIKNCLSRSQARIVSGSPTAATKCRDALGTSSRRSRAMALRLCPSPTTAPHTRTPVTSVLAASPSATRSAKFTSLGERPPMVPKTSAHACAIQLPPAPSRPRTCETLAGVLRRISSSSHLCMFGLFATAASSRLTRSFRPAFAARA